MSQSLSLVIVHLVFSTKDRSPCLKLPMRSHLHAYLMTVAREADCKCYRVSGGADHVHLAVSLSRNVTIIELVKELKRKSTRWLKTQYPTLPKFSWQLGYGSFSVGPAELETIIAYMDNQDEHHRIYTFQEEYRELLDQYKVAFDERHVWD